MDSKINRRPQGRLPLRRRTVRFAHEHIGRFGQVLMALAISWAGMDIYLATTRAATYAVPMEAEGGSTRGNAALVFENIDGSHSGMASVRFGLDGKCSVLYDQELADQGEAFPPVYRWTGILSRPATVYFEMRALSAEYRSYAEISVARWNKLAPECLDARAVASCPVNSSCVKLTESTERRLNDDGGDVYGEFTYVVDLASSTFKAGAIVMYTAPLAEQNALTRQITTDHEIGHAFGLRHRSTPDMMMYPFLGVATKYQDEVDRANLFVLYGEKYYRPGLVVPDQDSSPAGDIVVGDPILN